MKRLLSVLLIIICILCGCVVQPVFPTDSFSADSSEPSVAESEDVSKEETSAPESAPDDGREILNSCLEQFGTDLYWKDSLNPFKYILLSDSQIVCLLAAAGVEQTTVIPLSSVSKMDTVKSASVAVVTIYDKTGSSVSICLDPEQAEDLTSRIHP